MLQKTTNILKAKLVNDVCVKIAWTRGAIPRHLHHIQNDINGKENGSYMNILATINDVIRMDLIIPVLIYMVTSVILYRNGRINDEMRNTLKKRTDVDIDGAMFAVVATVYLLSIMISACFFSAGLAVLYLLYDAGKLLQYMHIIIVASMPLLFVCLFDLVNLFMKSDGGKIK